MRSHWLEAGPRPLKSRAKSCRREIVLGAAFTLQLLPSGPRPYLLGRNAVKCGRTVRTSPDRCATGAAHDEARRNDDALVGPGGTTFDLLEDQLGRARSHFLTRPAHGRQRHTQDIAVRDVARPDDGDVLRHTEPRVPDGFHGAHGRRIVGCEYRRNARTDRE